MTTPGEGHETVTCPNCSDCVGGDDPFCPFCGHPLWDLGDDDEEELFFD